MKLFKLSQLEEMLPKIQVEHYHVSSHPLLAVVYTNTIENLQGSSDIIDFVEQQGLSIDKEKNNVYMHPSPIATFVREGRLTTVKLVPSKVEGEKYAQDWGIAADSAVEANEDLVMDHIDKVVASYNAKSLWKAAKTIEFCAETAYEHEKAQIKYEAGVNLRYVNIFPEDSVNQNWFYDNTSAWSGIGQENTKSTLKLVVSNHPLKKAWGKAIITAQSPEPILNRHLKAAGLLNSASGSRGDHEHSDSYFAPETNETGLYTAFDKLAEIMKLDVTKDER